MEDVSAEGASTNDQIPELAHFLDGGFYLGIIRTLIVKQVTAKHSNFFLAAARHEVLASSLSICVRARALEPIIPVVCFSSHCIIMAACVLYMVIKGILTPAVITALPAESMWDCAAAPHLSSALCCSFLR